jgi:hypothetical protein
MLINKQLLLEEVLDNPDAFKQHLPSLNEAIDKFVEKPKCGVCKNNFIKQLLALEGSEKKLSIIFDAANIELSGDIINMRSKDTEKTIYKPISKVEVFFVKNFAKRN